MENNLIKQDPFWKENSELALDEMNTNFPEIISNNLKSQKSYKSKPIRLKPKEQELIEFIRSTGIESLVSDLKNDFYKTLNVQPPSLSLKTIISILEEKEYFSINDLINSEDITKEKADYLIKCMEENKNIIITGKIGVGKSSVLNNLLDYQENKKMILYRKIKEFDLSLKFLKKNPIILQENKSINMKDFSMFNENTRFIIDEISSFDISLSMITALNMKSSILATMYSKENWREYFLEFFSGNTRKFAEETINKTKFVQVIISIDSNDKRRIDIIDENVD